MRPANAPLDLRLLLEAVEDAPPDAAVDAATSELARAVGARRVSFLIADFSGRTLVRLVPAGTSAAPPAPEAHVPLLDTPHGKAMRLQAVQMVDDGDGARLIAPVTNRGEAIGVLEMVLPVPPDESLLAQVASAAHALGYIVIANRRHTDLYEWGQRSRPVTLAAEIQRRLLPGSFTCEAGQFTLAGWVQPAHDAAGDTFDYALEQGHLHLSMTDAMGHEVGAALVATLVVGSLRNSRRAGMGITAQAAAASEAVADHAGGEQFVTGQLIRVDLRRGAGEIVNAGHPPPLRWRDGRTETVVVEADLPLGLLPGTPYRSQPLDLHPGDRLLLVTDGLLERNAARVDVPSLLDELAGSHPREVVHELTQEVLRQSGGVLRDDATVLCVDWHGGPPRDRTSRAGADRGPTS